MLTSPITGADRWFRGAGLFRRMVGFIAILFVASFVGCEPTGGANRTSTNQRGGAVEPNENLTGNPEAFKVAVSIPPLKFFTQRLAGNRAYVVSLLDETSDFMATTELSAEQQERLVGAKLFVKIGAPFEKNVAAPEGCKVRNMIKDVRLKTLSSHTEYINGSKSYEPDPYVWMSPAQVNKMLTEIYQGLREIDPEHYEEYTQNFSRLLRELNNLEGEIQRILLNELSHDILVMPPALGYFCDDFDLKQFTYDYAADTADGEFIRAAIERKIRVVLFTNFAPANLDQRAADLLGGATDVINPLAADYPNNLLRIASSIAGRRFTGAGE